VLRALHAGAPGPGPACPLSAPRASSCRRVDADGDLDLEVGLLDAASRTQRTYAIPDDPALVGTVLRWQSLVTERLHWSSLETTRVVGF